MDQTFTEDKTFDKVDFSKNPLPKGEYENCGFNYCEFSNSDLSEIKFIDCTFFACNLSLVKLNNTAFRNIQFRDCKMLGLLFSNCNHFGLSLGFKNCLLDHGSFYQLKIKKTTFTNSKLLEVDFTECDLTGSLFDNCDLARATFERTILEKTDFRTSFNFTIDPEINRIKKAKFSLSEISGLLAKYDIEIDRTS